VSAERSSGLEKLLEGGAKGSHAPRQKNLFTGRDEGQFPISKGLSYLPGRNLVEVHLALVGPAAKIPRCRGRKIVSGKDEGLGKVRNSTEEILYT